MQLFRVYVKFAIQYGRHGCRDTKTRHAFVQSYK